MSRNNVLGRCLTRYYAAKYISQLSNSNRLMLSTSSYVCSMFQVPNKYKHIAIHAWQDKEMRIISCNLSGDTCDDSRILVAVLNARAPKRFPRRL